MEIDGALNLPFEEQIKFFREKANIPTARWDDLWKDQHAKGFMVAGANRQVVADFRAAVDKAIAQGTTLKEFQKDFDGIVARNGWQYKGSRDWRSELIYDTNIRTSYMAGRYKQMTDPDVLGFRPYWEYRHGATGSPQRPRPWHLAWDGTVLPADDPWWNTHYPPNGWRCSCGIAPLSEGDMRRKGKRGPDEAPASPIDPGTGEPVGIDKGWGYNVGKAAWGESEAKALMEGAGKWKDLGAWGPEQYGRPSQVPVDAARVELGPRVRPGDVAALRGAFKEAVGGDSVFLKDPTGDVVCVNQAITDHIAESEKRWDGREEYFPLIPELIEDPYEVWVNFAKNEISGRIAIRKKYVKAVRIEKNRAIGLFAEEQDGYWIGGTFFRGGLTGAGNLRKGRLIYGRDH